MKADINKLKEMDFEQGKAYLEELGYVNTENAEDKNAPAGIYMDRYFKNDDDDDVLSFVTVYEHGQLEQNDEPEYKLIKTIGWTVV